MARVYKQSLTSDGFEVIAWNADFNIDPVMQSEITDEFRQELREVAATINDRCEMEAPGWRIGR